MERGRVQVQGSLDNPRSNLLGLQSKLACLPRPVFPMDSPMYRYKSCMYIIRTLVFHRRGRSPVSRAAHRDDFLVGMMDPFARHGHVTPQCRPLGQIQPWIGRIITLSVPGRCWPAMQRPANRASEGKTRLDKYMQQSGCSSKLSRLSMSTSGLSTCLH